MNYNQYHFSVMEYGKCILVGLGISGLIAWLFYRSLWGMLLFVPVEYLCLTQYQKMKIKQRKGQLLLEFRDGMQAVSGALLAGYSMENAWREAEKELGELHGEESLMCTEVRQLNAAVRMNQPLEKVLAEFAFRSGCEEIESFAEVFSFAKRSGGDFAKIIQTTVGKLRGRMEVEREITTTLAGKRLEGRIMEGMPMMILAYLSVTSADFMDVLYGNLPGVMVMSAALLAYLGAVRWSEHILDIKM